MSSLFVKKNSLIKANIKFLALGIFSVLNGFFLSCSQLDREFSSNKPSFVQNQERSRVSDRQISGINPLELLKLEQVKQELELSTTQIENLKQINVEIDSKLAKSEAIVSPNIESVNSPDFQQAESSREQVAQILSQEQLSRFKQIALQVYGWAIMSKEEVTEILAITPEQNQELAGFRQQEQQKLRNYLQIPQSKNPNECQKVLVNNYEKLIETTQESNQKLSSILNEDQVQTLLYLQGEKFDLNLAEIPAVCP